MGMSDVHRFVGSLDFPFLTQQELPTISHISRSDDFAHWAEIWATWQHFGWAFCAYFYRACSMCFRSIH